MLTLKTPDEPTFELIKQFIQKFELDDRSLEINQFTAAFYENELTGFGRIREHENCTEICSLGILEDFRQKNIGHSIMFTLMKRAAKDMYLVCIIPEYFIPLGFKITEIYPKSIGEKLNYCQESLVVPEKYVVMVKKRNLSWIS